MDPSASPRISLAEALKDILACRVSSDQMAQALSMDVGNAQQVEEVVSKAVSVQGPVQVKHDYDTINVNAILRRLVMYHETVSQVAGFFKCSTGSTWRSTL